MSRHKQQPSVSFPRLTHVAQVFIFLCGAALAAVLLMIPRAVARQAPAGSQAALAIDDQPYFSEVAPVAGEGHPAWVELTIGRVDLDMTRNFMPLIFTPPS